MRQVMGYLSPGLWLLAAHAWNSLLDFKLCVQNQGLFPSTKAGRHAVWLKECSLCVLSHLLRVLHTGSKQWALASCNTPVLLTSIVRLFLELVVDNVYPPKIEPNGRPKEPVWPSPASRIVECIGLTYRIVGGPKQLHHRDASALCNWKPSKSWKG